MTATPTSEPGATFAASSPSADSGEPSGYLLDRRARRLGGGCLLGGEPARAITLRPGGEAVLDRALAGKSVSAGAEASLVSYLVEVGILHPRPARRLETSLEVVIPAYDPPETLVALVRSLAERCKVAVVDDGSRPDGWVAAVEAAGGRVSRRPRRGGPSAARNAAATESDLVIYLDADIVLDREDPTGWLDLCCAHFRDPRVGVVAPRVRPVAPGRGGLLLQYEESSSPLDAGPDPGLVGPGRRLSYVPSAALIVRRVVLEQVGGFDEELRYGEDVDFLYRVAAARFQVRYEPEAVVYHPIRRGLSLVRQRASYGTSASSLHARHRGTVSPYRAGVAQSLPALCALAALTGRRGRVALLALSGGLTARAAARIRRRLPKSPVGQTVEMSLRATASAADGLLTAVRRAWWPLLLPLLADRRTRRRVVRILLLASFARARGSRMSGGRAPGWRGRTGLLLLGLLDDAAYSSGVLFGCARARSFGALVPILTTTPTDRRERATRPDGSSRSRCAGGRRR